MVQQVEIHEGMTLEDYASVAHLSAHVHELRDEAQALLPALDGRRVWMVNSTAQGGGVAEMLPKVVSMLRELGLDTKWAVIGSEEERFFALTKRLHNLIHGEGEPSLGQEDRQLYEAVNRTNAEALKRHLRPDDILVVHDPQPLPCGAMLKEELGLTAVWRCHIGLDEILPATRAAWRFMRPYVTAYDHTVFSAPEYIPDFLAGRVSVIHPAVDPLSHKNRELSPHKLVGILCNASLAIDHQPVLTAPFSHPARRYQQDGNFVPATWPEEIGLLYRPMITQVSRWDRLKGFQPLLEAFVRLKRYLHENSDNLDHRHRRRLYLSRLVLAGPEPEAIQDDPEAQQVLRDLCDAYRKLEPRIQRDIVLLVLPMASRKENALMVNALQRCSTIIVQNSVREGFGLTATEAMWKRVPVLGTRACGLRQQIRDGLDGRLIAEPRDPKLIADTLNEILIDEKPRDLRARSAQRRVHQEFLVFTQLRNWLRLLADCVSGGSSRSVSEAALGR